MNNNRNNRRRGRGNRNQSGGGNQLNRIDSRARGNAPQLLDKYKKLAQDAQHNGDRVQAEYYLQFADHYFRVIADNKARQDEARAKRNDNRGDDSDQRADDGEDNDNRRNDNRRNARRGRNRRDEGDVAEAEGDVGFEGEVADQEAEMADGSGAQTDAEVAEPKPRRRRAAAKDGAKETRPRKPRTKKTADDNEPAEIDSSVLPPAIGGGSAPDSEDGDALEAVG
ncbi:MAG: DUF4167 domain-containing protein, partial [Pseudomonadota bacterium]